MRAPRCQAKLNLASSHPAHAFRRMCEHAVRGKLAGRVNATVRSSSLALEDSEAPPSRRACGSGLKMAYFMPSNRVSTTSIKRKAERAMSGPHRGRPSLHDLDRVELTCVVRPRGGAVRCTVGVTRAIPCVAGGKTGQKGGLYRDPGIRSVLVRATPMVLMGNEGGEASPHPGRLSGRHGLSGAGRQIRRSTAYGGDGARDARVDVLGLRQAVRRRSSTTDVTSVTGNHSKRRTKNIVTLVCSPKSR